MMTTPASTKARLPPVARQLLGFDHPHPLRSPKAYAARRYARAAAKWSWFSVRRLLERRQLAAVWPAVTTAVLATVLAGRSAARGQPSAAVFAAAAAVAAGILLGSVATLERLELGRL